MNRLFLLCCLFGGFPVCAAEVQETRDPATGLLTWRVDEQGFSLELIQLQPDFVRAVYGSRGFPADVIEGIARYCVFGTIAVNKSDNQLAYRVADWRYVAEDGSEHRLKTKTEWLAEWASQGVPYKWSILPDDQVFEVGDWSQGFTTVELPREAVFDLIYSWKLNGESYVGRIEGMRCAPDELPGRQ